MTLDELRAELAKLQDVPGDALEPLRQHADDPSEFGEAPDGARPAVFLYPAG